MQVADAVINQTADNAGSSLGERGHGTFRRKCVTGKKA